MLKTEQNTQAMHKRVRSAASKHFGRKRFSADFEHGQWWITILGSGAQYSVVDADGPGTVDGFDFEQVTEGEE